MEPKNSRAILPPETATRRERFWCLATSTWISHVLAAAWASAEAAPKQRSSYFSMLSSFPAMGKLGLATRGSPSRSASCKKEHPSSRKPHHSSGVLRLGEPRSADVVDGPISSREHWTLGIDWALSHWSLIISLM